ncbi:MAG TPA: WhiB family transcriptional regulator [Actinospica sp.]|nr:WhiB family transcriptional regulator [Actinospica sp.]HWG26429.1 WhiB family transcriptional regulator [Actinospica sp.]
MADYSRLPGPNADVWDWQLRGLCRGKDSSLFFHPEGERGAARAAREQSAKEICLNCPVQKQCSEHALRVREPYGVWGGMTEEEREGHYQRQKALARARAVREKAALAEKAVLREKMLRDHELAKQQAEARRQEAEARRQEAAAAAKAEAPASVPAELAPNRSAPKKKTPVVAKPTLPRKRVAAAKPAKQGPAKTPANSKKRTPAKV